MTWAHNVKARMRAFAASGAVGELRVARANDILLECLRFPFEGKPGSGYLRQLI